jgi:hypothetical protein
VCTQPGDGVDPDIAWRELQGGHLGEHRQARLGRTVGAHPGRGLPRVQRGDRHQRTAFTQGPAGVFGHDDRARQAAVDDRAKPLHIEFGDPAEVAEPGGVDHHIDRAGLFEQRSDGCLVGDIDARRRMRRAELSGLLRGAVGIEVGDEDPVPLRRQALGGCPADT